MNIESKLSRVVAQRINLVAGVVRHLEVTGNRRSPTIEMLRKIDVIAGFRQGA